MPARSCHPLRHRFFLLLVSAAALVSSSCTATGAGGPAQRPSRPASSSAANKPAKSAAAEPTRPEASGSSADSRTVNATAASAPLPAALSPKTYSLPATEPYPVMLGIDVLEAQGFAAIAGKRVGLLTHPAGVNRQGVSTIDVLRRLSSVKLVALFGPEHGIYGNEAAEVQIADRIDARTRLPVYSLYGKYRKPTKAMLKGLDALVIDLQDIGTRSYTYVSCMRYCMEACFEEGVQVVVLDRPNPLGGLKVDGPPLDTQWMSYVGAFQVPYVHGLTIGELAQLAARGVGVLAVSPEVRARGQLTVIPMRGWRRSMRWPETGLRWVPTSPRIPDFSAVVGYPMTGLGTYLGGFRHGVGEQYPFRGLLHLRVKSEVIEKELRALKIPGIAFRRVSSPNAKGEAATGLYVEVTDWDDWRPTELNFHLMRLGCKLESPNPYASAAKGVQGGFLRHVGSTAFFNELVAKGARIDVAPWIAQWEARCKVYQEQSKRYWLYQ